MSDFDFFGSPRIDITPGVRFCAGEVAADRSALREALARATRAPEPEVVAALVGFARQEPGDVQAVRERATHLVTRLRERGPGSGRSGRVQSLMQTYDLGSNEGIALMCLAEALLRIPDAATRDALIRDKLGRGNWQQHLGRSGSMFVNAASWGLVITGKLVATHNEGALSAALTRLLSKSQEPLIRAGVDMGMRMLGEQFVMGETIEEALTRARPMQARGFRYSYDMLGEAALTESDALLYTQAYEAAIHAIGAQAQGDGVVARAGISIKLSALHPRYVRAQIGRVHAELVPRVIVLARLARRYDIGLNIDAEESDRLELSLDVLQALCQDPGLEGWNGIGFVVQAYQKRAMAALDLVIEMARRTGHRLMLRLVKGAYWDSEIKRAQVEGQIDFPVFTRKRHTDVSYLACARKLLQAPDAVYPQFATHNAQTVAAVEHIALRERGVFADGQYEFQCLHGMGETLYEQIVGTGEAARPCRVYAPVGNHETLLAYLVRRLLENGANSSFVHRMADAQVSLDELVQDPVAQVLAGVDCDGQGLGLPHPRIALPGALYGVARRNSEGLDLAHEPTLRALARAMAQDHAPVEVGPMLAVEAKGAVDVALARTARFNPADPQDCVAWVREANAQAVELALCAATGAADAWATRGFCERAELLARAADLLQSRRVQAMGLLIREAGKSWSHALAEVREAVDFLRYYAQQARLLGEMGGCQPLGPVVCISPWNFPLAIFMGQVSAALAAGNVVLAKPAEATPAIGAWAVQCLRDAGVPTGAVQLLPGAGPTVGAWLVEDARVQAVLFTGSTATAQRVARSLAERLNTHGQVVPLIAETGGQNAMVVDSSALLEQVVADAVACAFEAAGQRCSALRVLCVQEEVAERLLELIKGAMAELSCGAPAALQTDIGPVIDAAAQARIEAHVAAMQAKGRAVFRSGREGAELAAGAFFVPPTLIEIEDLSELTHEVFGPVLHVLRYQREGLADLLAQIRQTGYALTLGVHSRVDETIAQVVAGAPAGNVYVNRNMVGAVVGLQPFGGEGLSGTGPKAGGPLYLLRLLAEAPDDSALRLVRASGAVALSDAPPALLALHDWAVVQGRVALAQHCARAFAQRVVGQEAMLGGPTGEDNLYRLVPLGLVLCQVGDHVQAHEDLLAQLATVLASGARPIWPEHARAWASALPDAVAAQLAWRTAAWAETDAAPDLAFFNGGEAEALALASGLAHRVGPLVRLVRMPAGVWRVNAAHLARERSVSTNTAAAGGNASLIALGA